MSPPTVPSISHQFIVEQPISVCWEKLRDLTLANRYVPNVTDVRINTTETEGVGVHRTVFLDRKPTQMDETVVEWNEGSGFLLRLHNGEKPIAPIFKENFFRYELQAQDQRTLIRLSISYEPSGLVGRLLGKLAVERAFKQQLAGIAANMKPLYEDRPVT